MSENFVFKRTAAEMNPMFRLSLFVMKLLRKEAGHLFAFLESHNIIVFDAIDLLIKMTTDQQTYMLYILCVTIVMTPLTHSVRT